METKKLAAVDAHHHLWDLETNHYPWLTPSPEGGPLPDFEKLCQNYLLADFRADCANQHIVKSVHVQAEHDEEDPVRETAWLQAVADDPASCGFPHAIVAGANLERDDVEGVLVASGERDPVRARAVVNAAGLAADAVAARAGFDVDACGYRLHPCKGDYFALAPGVSLRLGSLVYPVPAEAGLGVHATLDLAGRIRFGPDAHYVERLDFGVDAAKAGAFADEEGIFLIFFLIGGSH